MAEESLTWEQKAMWFYLRSEFFRFYIFKHKLPLCEEWKSNLEKNGYGFCKHLVHARYRYFKDEIHDLMTFNGKND